MAQIANYNLNENNSLWYELIGDYYFPCLTVPAEKEQSVGVWGQRHKRYLKEHRPAFYNALLLSSKLNSCLAGIDQQAQEMMDSIIQQMPEILGGFMYLKLSAEVTPLLTVYHFLSSAILRLNSPGVHPFSSRNVFAK